MNKVNIAYISHGSTLNGAERVFVDALKSFKELNYNVKVILPYYGELVEKCNQYTESISILDLPWWIDRGTKYNFKQKLNLFIRLIKSTLKIIVEINRSNCDIVITNTIAIPSGAIAAFLLRKKHVWYIHEFGKEDHNFNFIFGKNFSCKLISVLSNQVLYNSFAVKSKFEKFIQSKKSMIFYYPVNVNKVEKKVFDDLSFSKDRPMIIYIFGRVSKSKGQLEALRAIEYLVKEKKYIIDLTIIGGLDDDYTNEIRGYIKDNQLSEFIKLLEFVSNPLDFMIESDLCLNCSVQEAFGLITIESMKLGIPVIGSNKGGNLELIQDFKNGLLYSQGNYLSLSEKIEYLYLNPCEIKEMGNYAFSWAHENFNFEKYKAELKQVVLDL